jgi:hypothetical protein
MIWTREQIKSMSSDELLGEVERVITHQEDICVSSSTENDYIKCCMKEYFNKTGGTEKFNVYGRN